MSTLLFKTGAVACPNLVLQPGKNTLGRNPANSVVIEEPSISGFHCEITLNDGLVTVKDLNSTNGTFIDGERVSEATLKPGSALQLGSAQFDFSLAAAAQSEAAPKSARV